MQRRTDGPSAGGLEQRQLLRLEVEADDLADSDRNVGRKAHLERGLFALHGHDLCRAEILRAVHLAFELRCVAEEDMLRPDAKDQLALGAILARCRNCNLRAGNRIPWSLLTEDRHGTEENSSAENR